MDWLCYRMHNERLLIKESPLWITSGGKALSRWPEETLQRHPQSLSEGLRHTNGVLGTDCTGTIKVSRARQQRSSYEGKRICEAERKRRQSKAKTNGPTADSMTLTCSTCNRQFRARIGLDSHQRTHLDTRTLFMK